MKSATETGICMRRRSTEILSSEVLSKEKQTKKKLSCIAITKIETSCFFYLDAVNEKQ